MRMTRKQFCGGLAATGALAGSAIVPARASAQQPSVDPDSPPTSPEAPFQKNYFFKNSAFEYVLMTSLGRAYQQAGNVGKILYVIGRIEDGNYESAYRELIAAGDEAHGLAERSAGRGHRESARQSYLWAQNFYDCAIYFADGAGGPSLIADAWSRMDACWLKAIGLFDPPIEQVAIPYLGRNLRGFRFRSRARASKRPLLILCNGSDGSALDMWLQGGAGGVARGYDCLTFDGPGQGYALWRQGLHFRPDWEKVITPVVDFALTLEDVDHTRIALQGISQGGYWISRAVAFEKRIAAAIADPGVVDVSTSWTATLPPPMVGLLKAGRKADFDNFMGKTLSPEARSSVAFRMRPYGFNSYFDTFNAAMGYNLRDVAAKISCPMLITAPANEAFWPGQSQQLYDLLNCPKTLMPFSSSEGADLHCEPNASGLRDLKVFDWLDETLRLPSRAAASGG